MAEKNYFDFDLLIERSGKKFKARVISSPAGQASIEFDLPFSALEIENFLLKIGRPRRGVRRIESSEMEAAKVFGGRLFETVFNHDIRGCLRSSMDEAESPQLSFSSYPDLNSRLCLGLQASRKVFVT